MMSQYVATKNPPWVRGGGLVQVPPGSSSILTAQQISHVSTAGTGLTNPLDPRTGAALANPLDPRTGAGLANPLDPRTAAANPLDPRTAAAVVAVAQNQQAQQGPAVSASFGASIAAITLTQQGIAIPASLAATTQVANVNRSMVVEIARLPQPGVALPTSLASTGTVSYPAPRLIAQPVVPAAVVQHNPPQQQYKQRVFTGTITKLHENFGFVDEDTFFQTSAVKGNLPKVGERVLVEATYNSSSPFKWNATRIQLLPNQVLQLNVQQSNNNRPALAQQGPLTAVVAAPVSLGISVTPNMNVGMPNMANNQPAFSNVAQQGRWQEMAVMETLGQQQQQRLAMQHNSPHPWIQEMEYAEIHENKGMRVSTLPRRHSPLRRESRRYRERERYSPPPRKRSRSPRRASSPRRRQRVVPRYMVQIPKISLDVKFGNVMELRRRYSNLYVPSDFCTANFVWQDAFPPNRPFTLDHPCTFHIVGKDIESVFDQESATEPSDADYSYSAKVMLLSTPSLNEIFHKSCALAQDGEDVKDNFVHPTRLISFLVGLKGKSETVAIGGPWSPSLDGPHPDKDPQTLINTAIRTCRSLTGIDLSQCSQWYRFAEIYYRRGESSSGRGKRVETVVLFMPDVWSCLPTRMEWDGMVATGCCKKPLQEEQPPEAHMAESEEEKKEPTHHSELDPKSIKVNELKRELEARNLSVKGLKSQLIARLTKALKTESEEESASEEKTAEEPSESDEQKKEKEDDKKELLEKLNFPENPAIVVQASKTAKNGKFDCAVMSLSLLLDYRQEDNKEHSFEVSLFAELFNEMMMRDFGFRIYRALVELPEAKDEEKKKGDKREDKKKEEDSRRDSNDSDKEEEDSDEDDYEDDKREKDRKKKRKKKMCTHDPHLLLSFVYFDQTHCGYLLDKDTEELLHTLGLMLSRAQVRKLIQKVCKRDTFSYRKLTDKPVDAEKPKTETLRITLEDLPLGNKKYIPALRGASEQNRDTSALVSYQGAMVDVGKLMEQLDRGEKARTETDEKVKHLQLQLESLSESSAAKEKTSQKLSNDLEEQRQRLRSAEEELRKVKSDADKYHKTLCSLKEGLQSSLFLTDSALQRRSRSSRASNRDPVRQDTSSTDHTKNAGTAASEESDVKIEEKNSNSNSMDSESDKTDQYEQDSMDAE